MIEILKCALANAKLNERHQTIAESYYWLRQYKLLAEKAIAELESQKPVGVVNINDEGDWYFLPLVSTDKLPEGTKFYTTPPQRTEENK